MRTTIALLGAGGTMGCRLTDNLKDHPDYDVRYVERNPAGIERMAQRGVAPTPIDDAIARAQAVILAVPDIAIKTLALQIVPRLRPGTIVVSLDPAAAYAGVLPEQAAWDFVMGHIRIELAIVFGYAGFPFSDGAKLAIEKAQEKIFQPDWKVCVLSREAIRRQVEKITGVN